MTPRDKGPGDTPEGARPERSGRQRHSGEYEMALNRVAIVVLFTVYLVWQKYGAGIDTRGPMLLTAIGAAITLAIFASIVLWPPPSVVRRVISMHADIGAMSVVMHLGGEATAIVFPMYWWVIFGNGFRFGTSYLLAAAAISLAAFAVVFLTTEFWWQSPHLSAGVVLGLLAVPAYAAKLIRDLSEAKAAAEQASKAKSRFLAAISHEFRTPLHAIVGMADLLLNADLVRAHRDMVSTVRKSAAALNVQIDMILDFSRLEAGRMPVRRQDFDLDAVLVNVAHMLRVQAGRKSLRLGLTVSGAVPERVHGNRASLETILVNLAGNAVKFTAEGHVNISVLVARSDRDAVRLRFEVADTGIGIAESALETVFEPFAQADDTILDSFGGTGLGLATAKQLAEADGGAIGVSSRPGVGTEFWFELPVSLVDAGEADGPGEAAEPLPVVVLSRAPALVGALAEPLAALPAAVRIVADLSELARLAAPREPGSTVPPVLVDMAAFAAMSPDDRERLAAVAGPMIRIDRRGDAEPAPIGDRNLFLAHVGDADLSRIGRCLRLLSRYRGLSTGDEAALSAIPRAVRPLRVLVADDNKTNRLVVAKILEAAGHTTVMAGDGEAAIDAVMEDRCDVVLMDANMPVLNGIEATKHLRVLQVGPDAIPIIALTADQSPEMVDACLAAGMNACLGKPINPRDLIGTIDRVAGEDVAPGGRATVPEKSQPARAGRSAEASPPVDRQAIGDLVTLGGESFAGEVMETFLAEADASIRRVEAAIVNSEWSGAAAQIHALKSTSANVGATMLADLCRPERRIGAATPEPERRRFVADLKAGLAAVRDDSAVRALIAPRYRRSAAG